MRIRINKIIFVIGLLFLCSISYSSDLPECPNSPYDESSDYQKTYYFQSWHNCIGMYIHSNGGFYEGPHINGNRSGFGYYEDAINSITGYFVNDYPNGKVTVIFKNGNKFVGVHKKGKRDRYGTFLYSDGVVWQGYWESNKFVSGKKYKPGEFNQTVRFYERPIYNFNKTNEETIEEEQRLANAEVTKKQKEKENFVDEVGNTNFFLTQSKNLYFK